MERTSSGRSEADFEPMEVVKRSLQTEAEKRAQHLWETTDAPAVEAQADGAELRTLAQLSREELAQKLRAQVQRGDGKMYVSREPNYEAADAVLAGDTSPQLANLLNDKTPKANRDSDGVGTVQQREIIGGDGRQWVSNTTGHPFDSIVRYRRFVGNTERAWCTGFFIGPWTMLTAAHCLIAPDGTRINRMIFQPARNGSSFPYGQKDCRNDDADPNNDIYWAAAAGYVNDNSPNPLDYAVVDTYPCLQAPAHFGGYLINADDAWFSMYGYPQDNCPGAPAGQTTFVQCGMSGNAYDQDGWRIETDQIDSTGGQSGAPWFRMWDIWRPAAIHSGYRPYWDFGRCGFDICKRNVGRRIDSTVNTFIQQQSWDY